MTSRYHTPPDNAADACALNSEQESNVREGRRAPFKQLPDAVMDDDTISPMGKVLYWYLLRVASPRDHRGQACISMIAVKIGLPATWRRTVPDCLDELVKAGWLEVLHRKPPVRLIEPTLDYVVHAVATPTCNGGAR